jgi:hypothetical protein
MSAITDNRHIVLGSQPYKVYFAPGDSLYMHYIAPVRLAHSVQSHCTVHMQLLFVVIDA